ncbi:MAG: tetratricopeptide repeat protein, partial [Armatimonadota bacterium]
NPVQQVRRPANWDDRGEVYLLGTGPDLLLDLQVPAGLHRLSLYFVNDHTYYEPNREYTVYVMNAADEVLASASVRDFLNGVYEQFGVVGPQALTIRICRELSMNVLLSGVFLDPIEPPPARTTVPRLRPDAPALASLRQAQGARRLAALQDLAEQTLAARPAEPESLEDTWIAWQIANALHLGSASEHEAFARFAEALADERGLDQALGWLDRTTLRAFDAREYGLAQWAAARKTTALLAAGERDAAKQHLRDTMDLFLQETDLFAPIPVTAAICLPFAEDAYREYLAMRVDDLDDPAYASLLRRDARAFSRDGRASLMRIALAELQKTVGEEALTAADHRLLTMCSRDEQADIERLQAQLAEAETPGQRRDLQMLLLGRYFSTDDPEAALQVAEALGEASGDAEDAPAGSDRAAANALYNVGVYHFQRGDHEQARPLLERVIAEHLTSHFAEYARRYLDRMAAPDEQ